MASTEAKTQERAAVVFQALCSYLVREVSIGRTVHVPNLGLFFHGGPGQMRFKVLEKLLPPEHRWDGPSPGVGPIAKLRVEKIAQNAGVHKDVAEEMLQTVVKDFWTAVQGSTEVDLDFPGVGTIKVKEKTLSFEPIGPTLRSTKVTAEHSMFSSTASELWKKMPRSQHELRSKEMTESFASPTSRIPPPDAPLPDAPEGAQVLSLRKSSSTPVLKPLHHESKMTGSMQVQFLKSFKDRKLASLKEDAETLSKRFTRQLPMSERLFPPMLDRCSRTRSALFRESVNRDHISNVIGSNYSPFSSSLTIDHEAHASLSDTMIRRKAAPKPENRMESAEDVRNLDWTAEWPKILDDSPVASEINAVDMSKQEFCRILSRYRHYTEGGVPAEVLAPYHRQWLEHAVLLLEFENPSRWPMLGEEEQNTLIEELRHEILKGYIRAAKTSVVNYALLDERCKSRLDVPFIPCPPPIWGDLVFEVPDIRTPGGPPQHWRAGLQQARNSLAGRHVQNSATALRLVDFWLKECQEVRLVNLPSVHAECCDINTFFAAQNSIREMGLQELSNNWQQVIQIVSEEPQYLLKEDPEEPGETSPSSLPGGANPDKMEAHFFNSTASLLSQLARNVVEQSLEEYVMLFRRFEKEPLHYSKVKALTSQDKWQDDMLANKLVVGQQGDVRFKHEVEQVHARLMQPYKDCTTCLRELPRPDAKLKEMVNRTLLWQVKEEEMHIKAGFDTVESIVEMNLANMAKALELYDPFKFLLVEEDHTTAFFEDQSNTREKFTEYLQHLRDTVTKMREQCPNILKMQMMRVDATEVNQKLEQCAEDCIAKLLKSLAVRNQDRSSRLVKQFEHLNGRIMRQPENEEQLVELETAVEEAKAKILPSLLEEYEDIKAWLFLTWDQEYLLTDEDYSAIWAASEWKTYGDNIKDREKDLEKDRMTIESKLSTRRNELQEDLMNIMNSVLKFKDKGQIRYLDEYLDDLTSIKKNLGLIQARCERIQYEEELVGWEAGEFEINEAFAAVEPYDKLWTLVFEQQKANQRWTRSPLFNGEIKPEEVENEVMSMWRLSFKLKATFEQDGQVKPAKVAEKVKNDLDAFKENVPLLHALCNPGLRDRHWQEISNIIGFEMGPDPTLTLNKALDLDIGAYVQRISEISESAAKEYQIESGLEGMIKEWEPVMMEFKDWGTTGTYIVAGTSIDEVQTLLDDHVIKTQTMKGSPYAAEFKERLEDWEKYLTAVQDVVDVWLKVQGVWLYLEPIFSSEDIMQQMPTEGRLFREVDGTWRQIMAACVAAPKALEVFRQDNFLENLTAANDKLETVQKGLNDYLETKRLFFPRFFFLSNDNLLEILSETKDPKRVNAHVKKCFEGMQSLQFEENLNISGMISPEKELVPMTNYVDPVAANGAVEKWLVQVEDAMLESIRDQSFQSRDDYVNTPFVDWVQKWPGQVVIGIFNLFWTLEVNEALSERGNAGLVDYATKLDNTLTDIVNLVRREIPKLVRCTLEALIVIFVHNKDTIVELRDRGTSEVTDFDWLVQLRYFIEENPEKPGDGGRCSLMGQCTVLMHRIETEQHIYTIYLFKIYEKYA